MYACESRMLAAKHIEADARSQKSYVQTESVCSDPEMSTGPAPSGKYSARSKIKVSESGFENVSEVDEHQNLESKTEFPNIDKE